MEGTGDGIAVPVGDGENLAPGIIGIPGHHVAAGIQDGNDIPLQVFPEGVPYSVVADRTDAAISIVVIESSPK